MGKIRIYFSTIYFVGTKYFDLPTKTNCSCLKSFVHDLPADRKYLVPHNVYIALRNLELVDNGTYFSHVFVRR